MGDLTDEVLDRLEHEANKHGASVLSIEMVSTLIAAARREKVLREEVDKLSNGVIHQAIIGNDGSKTYNSVPEMVADLTRQRAIEAEQIVELAASMFDSDPTDACDYVDASQRILSVWQLARQSTEPTK